MIIRIKEKIYDPYARIPNRILNDRVLSWKAKGILAYCMSKPENWEIRVTDLIKRSSDGESAVRSALKELIEKGYCKGERVTGDDGRSEGYHYDMADFPYFSSEPYRQPNQLPIVEENLNAEIPHVEIPQVENHHHSNKENNTEVLLDKEEEKEYGGRPKNVPFQEILAIFDKYRPHKKFVRRKQYGVVEKGISKFWRENDKTTQCFYDLCDRLDESDYLMGQNGHIPPVQIKDPPWSWVFKIGNDQRLNAHGIIEGKYANDRMAFALEKNKQEALEEVFLVGFNEKRKVDLSDPKFKVLGIDDASGLKKVVEVN